MMIGYARVSTEGYEKIFRDTVSGMKKNRPGLDDALSYLLTKGLTPQEASGSVLWVLFQCGSWQAKTAPKDFGLLQKLTDSRHLK